MYKKLFIFIALSLAAYMANAQSGIQVKQSEEIKNLVEKHKSVNETKDIEGYQIHLFFESGNDARNKAYGVQNRFETLYPYKAYVSYKSPYYKVQAGNFRTKLEAQRVLEKIKTDFPAASIRKVKRIEPGLLETED